jgi:hypothetical protein
MMFISPRHWTLIKLQESSSALKLYSVLYIQQLSTPAGPKARTLSAGLATHANQI